MPVIELLVGPT